MTSARLDSPPLQSFHSGTPRERKLPRVSNLLNRHTLILHLLIIGSPPPPPPRLMGHPPPHPTTLSSLMCSCSSGGFRFGRLMELAQGSAAQRWGGDRYITITKETQCCKQQRVIPSAGSVRGLFMERAGKGTIYIPASAELINSHSTKQTDVVTTR